MATFITTTEGASDPTKGTVDGYLCRPCFYKYVASIKRGRIFLKRLISAGARYG
jgi:hypothetical protein